jgi:hypothetical protein
MIKVTDNDIKIFGSERNIGFNITATALLAATDYYTREISLMAGINNIQPSPANVLSFSCEAKGAAVTNLALQIKYEEGDDWHDYIADADWQDDTQFVILRTSATAPNTLPATSKSWSHVRLLAAYAIRFRVRMAAAGTLNFRGATSQT